MAGAMGLQEKAGVDCFHTFKIEGGNSSKYAFLYPCSNNSCLLHGGCVYSVAQSLQT